MAKAFLLAFERNILKKLEHQNVPSLSWVIFLFQNQFFSACFGVKNMDTLFLFLTVIFIFSFYVRYSTLLHLTPLRFRCVGGCWDRTQDSCDYCSNHSARSHPLLGQISSTLGQISSTTRLDLIHYSARSHPHSARSHPHYFNAFIRDVTNRT